MGQERFVIRQILQEKPYLTAQVEAFPALGEDSPRAWALSHRLREVLPTYIDTLAQATGTLVQVLNVPENPLSLAFLVALVLQISLPERQRLLATAEVADMLAQEMAMLRRETTVWRYMVSTREAQKQREDGRLSGVSPN